MEAKAILCAAVMGAWLALGCSKAKMKGNAPDDVPPSHASGLVVFVPPDQTTPERTLQTFWWAIGEGKDDMALVCVDRERVAEGRHGRDIERFIDESRGLDTNRFVYFSAGSRVTIRSADHCMDYDMDKVDDERWVIVAIHP